MKKMPCWRQNKKYLYFEDFKKMKYFSFYNVEKNSYLNKILPIQNKFSKCFCWHKCTFWLICYLVIYKRYIYIFSFNIDFKMLLFFLTTVIYQKLPLWDFEGVGRPQLLRYFCDLLSRMSSITEVSIQQCSYQTIFSGQSVWNLSWDITLEDF